MFTCQIIQKFREVIRDDLRRKEKIGREEISMKGSVFQPFILFLFFLAEVVCQPCPDHVCYLKNK